MLGRRLRADSVLQSSRILGGSQIGRTDDGAPLDSVLSKIITSARLRPPRNGTDTASLLGSSSSSLLGSLAAESAEGLASTRRQGAGGTSTTTAGAKASLKTEESVRGLSVFQTHTSALKAQLQDLHRSLEEPRASWDKVEASNLLTTAPSGTRLTSQPSLHGVAAAALMTPARAAAQTPSASLPHYATSGLVLRPATQASTDIGAATFGKNVETATLGDTTCRSINWSPGASISVFAGGGSGAGEVPTPMHSEHRSTSTGAALSGLRNGRTPRRASPLEGVRGAALSTESSLLDGGWGENGATMRRTGSLSPGDDT